MNTEKIKHKTESGKNNENFNLFKNRFKTKKQQKEGITVMFWNIAGLTNKDQDFWSYIVNFDVIFLLETWLEDNKWKKIKASLPTDFNWENKAATKDKNKGRAKGGILLGVKKALRVINIKKSESSDLVTLTINSNNEVWKVIGIYNRNGAEQTLLKLDDETQNPEERIVIGGDFNARIGEEGTFDEELETREKRRSKDKIINREGKFLMKLMEQKAWFVLNGNVEGDRNGEFTYMGPKADTVIDYVITDINTRTHIEDMTVEEGSESDHLPLAVKIKTILPLVNEKEKEGEKENTIKMEDWTLDGIEHFQNNIKQIIWTEGSVKEEVEEMVIKLNKAIKKKSCRKERRRLSQKWWDVECYRKKKLSENQ